MADERMVLTDGIKCEWCGADIGEPCRLQPAGPRQGVEMQAFSGPGSRVHLVRSMPKAEHDAWMKARV